MALEAGELTLVLEFATGLKDVEWFGRQDPFCVVTCGSQTYRSKTATDGGKNPVWNETFKFNVINENDFSLHVKDRDVVGNDDYIGLGRGQLAKVRTYGSDKQQVTMMSKKGKQHGFVQVSLIFTKNSAIRPPGAPSPGYGAPPPYGAPAPGYGAPPPHGYGAPAPGYGAPPQQYPPQQYPPQQYPPQQYPPQQYPPQQYPPHGY